MVGGRAVRDPPPAVPYAQDRSTKFPRVKALGAVVKKGFWGVLPRGEQILCKLRDTRARGWDRGARFFALLTLSRAAKS